MTVYFPISKLYIRISEPIGTSSVPPSSRASIRAVSPGISRSRSEMCRMTPRPRTEVSARLQQRTSQQDVEDPVLEKCGVLGKMEGQVSVLKGAQQVVELADIAAVYRKDAVDQHGRHCPGPARRPVPP